jgi:hypothetical protein
MYRIARVKMRLLKFAVQLAGIWGDLAGLVSPACRLW